MGITELKDNIAYLRKIAPGNPMAAIALKYAEKYANEAIKSAGLQAAHNVLTDALAFFSKKGMRESAKAWLSRAQTAKQDKIAANMLDLGD